jgi:UDP-glucose 4-epimerase
MNNIIATINLSKLAVKYETKRFIYFNSGGAIYCQSSNLKPCEDSKTDPKSPYGISKLASEVYAKQILSESNVEFLSLRLSNVYGDGQINGVITKFIKNMSAGLPCNFYGDGSSTRNYLHVLDLIEFLKMALRQEFVGVYNLGSDRSTSLIELFHIIRSNYTSNVSIKYLESIHKEVKNSDLCIDKALKTGWKPSISLEDGVRNLVISNKVNSFIDGINENV